MAFVQLQCVPWDKIYWVETNLDLKVFDKVIVKTDAGLDLAKIIDVADAVSNKEELDAEFSIIRLAEVEDLNQEAVSEAEKKMALEACNNLIETHQLKMKLADVHYSLDGTRMTFAFIADGRIDFRALVKDLNRFFNKNIRLQQVGIRDEARIVGDIGRCGRGLCCKTHLAKFNSVTADMAEAQTLNTRGSDRISGACGRLMCCLAYEVDGYKDMAAKMPNIGSKITYEGRKGTVIAHHLLKQTIKVEFDSENKDDRTIAEVDLNKVKR